MLQLISHCTPRAMWHALMPYPGSPLPRRSLPLQRTRHRCITSTKDSIIALMYTNTNWS